MSTIALSQRPDSAAHSAAIVQRRSIIHKPKCHCEFTEKLKRSFIGIVLMVAVGCTWVGSTEFTKSSYQAGFSAPFFVMYFCSSWMLLFYPLYILLVLTVSRCRTPIKDVFRESAKLYHREEHQDVRLLPFIWKTAVFCAIWALTNYVYVRALGILKAIDVTALFSTNQSFVYMLSWIVLFEKFVAIRIVAMIFSITGIVLFAYVDGFGSSSMWGVVLAVASAAGAAVFKVLFKKFVGDASYGQVSLFLSLIGAGVCLFLWPLVLTLYFTKSESIDWSTVPWKYLCGAAAFALVYQFLVNFAVAATFPIFVGLGIVIGIPLCAAADIYWRHPTFPGMKIAAIVLITIGLLLILLPDDWQESTARRMHWKRRDDTDLPPTMDIHHRTRLRAMIR